MKEWRFEISSRSGFADVVGQGVLEDIRELGIRSVESVHSARVYLIEADFDAAFAKRVVEELLTDTVCQDYYIGRSSAPAGPMEATIIEVHLKSGVTDPVAQSVAMAIADMGGRVQSVRTARKYILLGHVTDAQRDLIARRVLANDCIEEVVYGTDAEPPSPHTRPYELQIVEIPITGLDSDGLMEVSRQRDLFLDLTEMQTIQKYYRGLKREPTDVELETLAQTWSEHCVHKTLRSSVELDCDGKQIRFDNLLKETVFKATQELNKDWCISVFTDNAGVVAFDEEDAVCFKVETHNHPSALDPYGGAATGIGGVLRDPMGTGLGAKPIANTDVFCFGNPDKKLDEIPKGVLHPRRIMKGVVAGVRDYGNRMGVPTVNGAIYFDDRYMANPLVFCGNVGLIPYDKCFKHPQAGNLIMVVGGRTGRDGIHGATFSSGQMTHEHENIFSHAVQIGNPIVEKKMLDTLLQARDAGLYEAITDCGAGGLSSAVGEMGEKLGAEVDLEKVPLKYAGLSYTEIWISEAQERMVIAVRPENLEAISRLFAAEDVEATVIGRFTGDRKLTLRYEGQVVGQLDMEFLHEGICRYSRKAVWKPPAASEPVIAAKDNYNDDLRAILSSYNVASKEWVIRQYDHEVQGGSVIKPLVGAHNDGPSDAAVIRPKLGSQRGLAISCGMNPLYGDIDPYWMAYSAIDEAIRNIVAVGARPDRIALLDNFCWGDCRKPETFGALVRAAQACLDGAMAFGTPFISGKDSLNNEFLCDDGTTIAIPSTLLISAISIVDDVNTCVTMDVKKAGNLIFVVGLTRNELGGSHYYKIHGCRGANVPKVDAAVAAETAARMHRAIQHGLIVSCHDCSEGGLAVALAEMAFAGDLGIEADLRGLPCDADCVSTASRLFSESNSRYVVEVEPDMYDSFARLMLNLPFGQLGTVVEDKRLVIRTGDGSPVISADLEGLREAWRKPLMWG
ncbi:MAG TPA: phosphoribosylformylglycinamidine synthase subunit PurL [Anaerohalosphaeraceae bacterium]|nr:phosphoribosylformylglycinamidine synthase subunit PurL [Anaerohalosphaeraceae bacterium]HRT51881.1 phosphoribosylformylglycinamidine synthase subunit PurL [Anaerohalosphaeraceae bacterium]HRT87878.1 phosphoribosylformylglycinamidine synthase subunit PurL [Anaerohalosphaeraceae bacterium]